MLKLDMSLTEGVEEFIEFCLTAGGEAVAVEGYTWSAFLSVNKGEAVAVRTEHGAARGSVVVVFPALGAGSAKWELWRTNGATRELFLYGDVTVFSVEAVREAVAAVGLKRVFEVRTEADLSAVQVEAMPTNAVRVLMAEVNAALMGALSVRRVEVDALPPADEAEERCVYYVGGVPYVVLGGRWMPQNAAYGVAEPNVPGLMCVRADGAGPMAEVKAGAGQVFGVELASADVPGVVLAGGDVTGVDEYGVHVRRAGSGCAGLVKVELAEEDVVVPGGDVTVLSAAATRKAINKVSGCAGDDKADVDFGNVDPAVGVDVVVSWGRNKFNYWRLWKSGWVEQGGAVTASKDGVLTISFLLPMADVFYWFDGEFAYDGEVWGTAYERIADTGNRKTGTIEVMASKGMTVFWQVRGRVASLVNVPPYAYLVGFEKDSLPPDTDADN